MKKEEVDILLKKYYGGTSTEEDEKILKDFFRGSGIPEGYEVEKAIFSYFKDSAIPAPADDFEDRIISSLGQPLFKKRELSRLIFAVSGIAAGILIIIGSWFLFSVRESKDTYTDPQIAYAETVKILYGVSEKLNQGTAVLEPVSKMNLDEIRGINILSESSETIGKNLRNLEYLDKIIEMTNVSNQGKN